MAHIRAALWVVVGLVLWVALTMMVATAARGAEAPELADDGDAILDAYRVSLEAEQMRMLKWAPPRHTHATAAPHTHRRVSYGDRVDRWRPLVARYFASSQVNKALRVIRCESGGDPAATSRSGTYRGLFQQSKRYWDQRAHDAGWGGWSVYSPKANIAVSAWMVSRGGWGPWSCG